MLLGATVLVQSVLLAIVQADVLQNPDLIGPIGVKGPQGQRGPQGPRGTSGKAGDVGPIGPAGDRGVTGEQGDAGPPGPPGRTQGPPGDIGPKGLTGPAGQKGPTGPTGYAGINGDRGEPGEDGDAGTAVTQGEPGAKGEPGDDGDEGSPGETGPQGEKGTKGEAGPIIPDGFYFCDTLDCGRGKVVSLSHIGIPFCRCECEKGLYLVNETKCIDVCLKANGGCQQKCQQGGCSCESQYSVDSDNPTRCVRNQCDCSQGRCIGEQNCVDDSNWKFQIDDAEPAKASGGLNLRKGIVFLAILIWLIILTIILIIALCFACVRAWRIRKQRRLAVREEKNMTQFFFPAPYAMPALQVEDQFSDSPEQGDKIEFHPNNNYNNGGVHNQAYAEESFNEIDTFQPTPQPQPEAPTRKRRSKAPPPPPPEPEPEPEPAAYMNVAYDDDQPTYANQIDDLPPAPPPKDYQDTDSAPALPPKDYR